MFVSMAIISQRDNYSTWQKSDVQCCIILKSKYSILLYSLEIGFRNPIETKNLPMLKSFHKIGSTVPRYPRVLPWGLAESIGAFISHASKVMLKILQARLHQYVNYELPDALAGFKKGRGTKYQIANVHWIIKKAREFQKNIDFCFINYAKTFNCVITTNCGKFFKRWEYQTTWSASWETCMQVRKQQLELDMEQQTGSK